MHSFEVPSADVSTQSRRQAEVEALGRAIKAERNAAGMTLEDLGAAIGGVHRNTISKYEVGRLEVPFGTLVDIADALKLPVTDLVRSAEERARREAARSTDE